MKKFYLLLITMLTMALSTFSQEPMQVLNSMGGTTVEAVSTVYNDTKSAVSTVYNDMVGMSGPIYNEVKNAVVSIGKGIGCAAEHVYTVMVKKYVVEGVSELCYLLVGIFLLGFGIFKTNSYFKTKEKLDWKCLFPLGLLASGLLVVLGVDFSNMLINLINPEWKALEYIIETTKTLVK